MHKGAGDSENAEVLHAFELAVGELGKHVRVPTVARHLASPPLTSRVHVGKGGAKPHCQRKCDEKATVHLRVLDSLHVARDVGASVLEPLLFASRGVGLAKDGVFPAFAYRVVKEAFGSGRLELATVPRVFAKVVECVRIKMQYDRCIIPNVGQTRIKIVGFESKCPDTASKTGQRRHVMCLRYAVDGTQCYSLARRALLPHLLLDA